MSIWIFLGCLLGGMVCLVYYFRIVKLFGHIPWAERTFGPAGTYTLWRLVGVLLIIVSFIVLRYGSSLGL